MLHVSFRRPDRLVEYFVQVGLQDPPVPLIQETEKPITDVFVIYDRTPTPAGFEKLEFSVSGGSGNLSAGGNIFSPAVWLCVSRQKHEKGPLTDITIVYLDREDGGKVPPGYSLLKADLNQGSYGYNIGLCYTRQRLTGSRFGPIMDIGIVNAEKHDIMPPRYRIVGGARRNVNAGSFRDEIYLVAKHAIRDPLQVKYKPTILDRYPQAEIPGSPLPTSIALFCCPNGIEIVPSAHGPPPASYASCVLTTDQSVEIYCACLTFYELYQGDLPPVDDEIEDEQKSSTSSSKRPTMTPSRASRPRATSAASFSELNPTLALYVPRKLCLVSYWPFFGNFCQYLEELYRHSRLTSRIPIERLIRQLWETPLPGSGKMRVQLEMGAIASNTATTTATSSSSQPPTGRVIVFERPRPDDFPMANFPLTFLFRILSLSNILIFLSAVLQEKKVIMASKVLPLLTYVGETIRTLIFPLKWMHPYIPILPAPLSGMLDAPMPIFVGVAETFINERVLTGDDLVIVYLDRDEIKIGGNGKDAYSTNSVANAAILNAALGTEKPTSNLNGPTPAAATLTPSTSSSSLHSVGAGAVPPPISTNPSNPVPDKLPHLTLLPRKLLLRLVHELRQHTNVTRLKKFTNQTDVESYFYCFRGTTTAPLEEEIEDQDAPSPTLEYDPHFHTHSRNSSDGGSTSGLTPSTSYNSLPLASIGNANSVLADSKAAHSNLLAIRACFLHIFVTLLGGMDAYLRFPTFEKGSTHTFQQLFDAKSYLDHSDSKSRPFIRTLMETQMFNYFVEEKTNCQDPARAMELAFFTHAQSYELELDQSIQAAKKMGGMTAQTAPKKLGVVLFLSQLGTNYTTFNVPPPDVTGLEPDTLYSYAEFPRHVDVNLINRPALPPPQEEKSASPASPSSNDTSLEDPNLSTNLYSPIRRTLSDPGDEGVVLYTPIREPTPPLTSTTTNLHGKSASSHVSSTTLDMITNALTTSIQTPVRHIKSHSSDTTNMNGRMVHPLYSNHDPANFLTQTSQPNHSSNANGNPGTQRSNSFDRSTASAVPATSMNGGTRMFTGQRGPTVVMRQNSNGTNVTQPSQAPPPPAKKDTLTSIIDFLTTVKRPAPPTPTRPTAASSANSSAAYRSAPSTPQRRPSFGPSSSSTATPTRGPPPPNTTMKRAATVNRPSIGAGTPGVGVMNGQRGSSQLSSTSQRPLSSSTSRPTTSSTWLTDQDLGPPLPMPNFPSSDTTSHHHQTTLPPPSLASLNLASTNGPDENHRNQPPISIIKRVPSLSSTSTSTIRTASDNIHMEPSP